MSIKAIKWFYKVSTTWVLAIIILASVQAHADNVLRYRVTTYGGRMYNYWKFSSESFTPQSGDCIEYDVYLHSDLSGVGGIDIYNTDGNYYRDESGWVDQNGITGHPAADLTSVAYLRWYHRKLAVPKSMVGKTISLWDVVVDGYGYDPYDVFAAMYDNICITRNGSVVKWIYQDGSPSLNTLHFNTSSTVQSAALIVTPSRKPVQVSAHFFYWYNAPDSANPDQMTYDPHGVSTTGAWSGYGYGDGYSGYYSIYNQAWWESAFQDVKASGCNVVDLICWGDHPQIPYFRNSVISDYMVPALERSGVDIKIALFDDTSSELCEWNYDNGRGYTTTPPMPLSDQANWTYFYDKKIKPFFQAIPQKYWATHNGESVDNGGRPIIITYNCTWYSDVSSYATPMWNQIKTRFANDFKNSSGQGITPFIVHESSWYYYGNGASADSYYNWGTACNGPTIRYVNNYYTGSVGPGFDNHLITNTPGYADRRQGNQLLSWYNGSYSGRRLWDCNLVLMETWNELWEGTAIGRCVDYPDENGGYLPETFYMDKWGKNCVTTSIGRCDLDATFLRTWTIPKIIIPADTTITTQVRNDGLLPWSRSGVSLGARLLDPATKNVVPGTQCLLTALPEDVLSGSVCSITWHAPASWPLGQYLLQLDLWNGSEWFTDAGDLPVSKRMVLVSGTSGTNMLTNGDFSGTVPTIIHNGPYSLLSGGWTYSIPSSTEMMHILPESIFTNAQYHPDGYTNAVHVRKNSNTGNPGDVYVYQDVDVSPNTNYFASAWVMECGNIGWHVGGTAANAELIVEQYDSTDTLVSSQSDEIERVDSAYTQLMTGLMTGDNTTKLRFKLHSRVTGSRTEGCYITWDDCSLVAPPAVISTVSRLKSLAEESSARVTGKVVTAAFDGFFYIEDQNRSSGIRVTGTASPGDIVNVTGAIRPVSGEKTLVSSSVTSFATGTIPNPLGVGVKAVMNPGLSTVGLYVKVWGRVTSVDTQAGTFVLSDGSTNELKVYGVANRSDYVVITGVMGEETSGSASIPVMRAVSVANAN